MATPTLSIIGYSAQGLPLMAYSWDFVWGPRTPSSASALVLGGVHGDEPEGVACAMSLINYFNQDFSLPMHVTIIPIFNPDGVLAKSRLNGNGVDLNRNLPTKDWDPKAFNDRYPPGPKAGSEPENKALIQLIKTTSPTFILSLHSWKPLLNPNGACAEEARAAQLCTGYAIEESIGYPTPGCLGTFAGLERGLPTLTYEIERGLAFKQVVEDHVPAALAALKAHAHKLQETSS